MSFCGKETGRVWPSKRGLAPNFVEAVRELESHALSWPLEARVSRTASLDTSSSCKTCNSLKKADEFPDTLNFVGVTSFLAAGFKPSCKATLAFVLELCLNRPLVVTSSRLRGAVG